MENHSVPHPSKRKAREQPGFAFRRAAHSAGTTPLVRHQIKTPTSAEVKRGQTAAVLSSPSAVRERRLEGENKVGPSLAPGLSSWRVLNAEQNISWPMEKRWNYKFLGKVSLLFHSDQQDTEGPGENLGTKFTRGTLMAISAAPGAGIINYLLTPRAHHTEITISRTGTV